MTKQTDITQTFIRYRKTLARFIRHIVKPQDIDDVVQETFVRAYQAELKHEIEYPKTFMLKTVKHLALNYQQRWHNRYNDSLEDFGDSVVNLTTANLESEIESDDRFLIFCRAVDGLAGQCRKVFILKKVYGLSQKEVAVRLKISESTVEKHVAKGMQACFDYMEALESERKLVHDGGADKPLRGRGVASTRAKAK